MAIIKNLSSKLYNFYEFAELNYRLSKSLEFIDVSNQICMPFQMLCLWILLQSSCHCRIVYAVTNNGCGTYYIKINISDKYIVVKL